MSQKGIETYNKTIAANNILVRLYIQQKGKNEKSKRFVTLHKQIGCRKSNSIKRIEVNRDWGDSVKEKHEKGWSLEALLRHIIKLVDDIIVPEQPDPITLRIVNMINWLENLEDWEGIYVNDKALNRISSLYLEDWFSLQSILKREKTVGIFNPKKESNEQFKLNQAVELVPVFNAIDHQDFDTVFKKRIYKDYSEVLDKKLTNSKNLIKLICYDVKQKIKDNSRYKADVEKILNTEKQHKEGYFQEDDNIDIIRTFLDGILDIFRFVRYFSVKLNKVKGAPYSMELLQYVSSLLDKDVVDWTGWYDVIRNYLCSLPQDEVKDNKLKLNFESSSLLKGWSVGEEQVKLSMIIKKDDGYYLCIIKNDRECKGLFDIDNELSPIYIKNSTAFRMILRNLAFRTLVGKGYVSKFKGSYSEEKDERKAIAQAQQLIRENYLQNYPDLESVVNSSYESKNAFQKDITKILANYAQCSYVPVDWKEVLKHAKKGEVYVFKINSKDTKAGSTGKKDLQTLYWEDVLRGESSHQLAANGEIFRREPIPKEKMEPFVHKEGSILLNKRDKDGKSIPEDIYRIAFSILNKKQLPKAKDNEEQNKLNKRIDEAQKLIDGKVLVWKRARFDITKDARFFHEAKYFLHNPICLNCKAKSFDNKAITYGIAYANVNPQIQEFMHYSTTLPTFIGVDRGEKNLIYACKVDSNGEIQQLCKDYNVVLGINYLEKLEERANERKEAKRSWKQQESIKNLKNGYISHVIHELLNEAIPCGVTDALPSYIVLEKLSREMKQGRQKIEKQVYQNFELALAQKLSFYVNKDIEDGQPGSVKFPLQFVPPVNTFDQIDKKDSFGIMLYTRANYTSVTDPLTGWRKTIYIANGNNTEIYDELVKKFVEIKFDGKDYVFIYIEGNVGKKWELYSGIFGKGLDRFEWNKDSKQYEPYDIIKILNGLFENFDKSQSLLQQLKNGIELKKVEDNRTAFQSLRKAINMIQQIKNTGIKKKDDNYLQSPVRSKEGKHFDTRKAKEFEKLHLIIDADANGAFNIARKGIIMDAHYREWLKQGKPKITIKGKKGEKDKETSALSLYVSDKEWDMWLLKRELWEKQLREFALKTND